MIWGALHDLIFPIDPRLTVFASKFFPNLSQRSEFQRLSTKRIVTKPVVPELVGDISIASSDK
jgi:hypothetical protein